MKIKEGFVVRKLGDQHVVVALSGEASKLNYLIKLNDFGAFLWNELSKQDLSEEELVKIVLDNYNIDEETASKDVHTYVEILGKKNLLKNGK